MCMCMWIGPNCQHGQCMLLHFFVRFTLRWQYNLLNRVTLSRQTHNIRSCGTDVVRAVAVDASTLIWLLRLGHMNLSRCVYVHPPSSRPQLRKCPLVASRPDALKRSTTTSSTPSPPLMFPMTVQPGSVTTTFRNTVNKCVMFLELF